MEPERSQNTGVFFSNLSSQTHNSYEMNAGSSLFLSYSLRFSPSFPCEKSSCSAQFICRALCLGLRNRTGSDPESHSFFWEELTANSFMSMNCSEKYQVTLSLWGLFVLSLVKGVDPWVWWKPTVPHPGFISVSLTHERSRASFMHVGDVGGSF